MSAEKTTKKKDKAQSKGPSSMGSGMSGMMSNCCTGAGAFFDCVTLMKGMKNRSGDRSCCASTTEDAGPREEKNERADR